MSDGSVDITAWIQKLVKESGLSSFQLQFHNKPEPSKPESSTKEGTIERAQKTDTTIPVTTTKETLATGEWRDLDTLLFPEDKDG